MSTLLYKKLTSTLEQVITIETGERKHIASIAPYLLMYNEPAGTFTFEIIKSAVTIFSQTFTSAQIKTSLSTANAYAHVFYPIIPTGLLHLEGGTYTLKLSASGYSPSELSFLGWCQQFENLQNELDYTPTNDTGNPLAIRIKLYK